MAKTRPPYKPEFRPLSSVTAAARPACAPRWARLATPTTLRHAGMRASRQASVQDAGRGADRCSSSSRLWTTTGAAVIRRSGISPQSTTSSVTRPIPTHTSLPPCSRRSRTSPSGGPQLGPSLTAAARDGRTIVRAGMKEWLRQGPNKRMTPDRRAKCRQTRYPDPKPSTVHQTGASPKSPWGRGREKRCPSTTARRYQAGP
jgi:hypothetical protein